MDIDLALGRYLTAEGIVTLDESGVSGDLFLGAMPSSPDVAVMLKPTGGFASTNAEDGYDEPTVQVMARGAVHDRSGPKAVMDQIYEALVGLHNVTLDAGGDAELYVVRVIALQSYPFDMGRDANERWEWSQNYALHVRNQTTHRT